MVQTPKRQKESGSQGNPDFANAKDAADITRSDDSPFMQSCDESDVAELKKPLAKKELSDKAEVQKSEVTSTRETFLHLEPMTPGEKQVRPRKTVKGDSSEAIAIRRQLIILDRNNMLKCDVDADVVAMCFALIRNQNSEEDCHRIFCEQLNGKLNTITAILREYFIMHLFSRIDSVRGKEFAKELEAAFMSVLITFVPHEDQIIFEELLKMYKLVHVHLGTSVLRNTRWLVEPNRDEAFCLTSKLYS